MNKIINYRPIYLALILLYTYNTIELYLYEFNCVLTLYTQLLRKLNQLKENIMDLVNRAKPIQKQQTSLKEQSLASALKYDTIEQMQPILQEDSDEPVVQTYVDFNLFEDLQFDVHKEKAKNKLKNYLFKTDKLNRPVEEVESKSDLLWFKVTSFVNRTNVLTSLLVQLNKLWFTVTNIRKATIRLLTKQTSLKSIDQSNSIKIREKMNTVDQCNTTTAVTNNSYRYFEHNERENDENQSALESTVLNNSCKCRNIIVSVFMLCSNCNKLLNTTVN